MVDGGQRRWSREQFLELLDDEDLTALRRDWALPPVEVVRRDTPDFLAALDARSTTTLLREVLALHTPTLQMLRDVLGFLTRHAAPVRTTGSLLVLDEELDIAPQQVDSVLKWSDKVLRRTDEETWKDLQRRFEEEIVPLFDKVEEYGNVDVRRRQERVMDSYRRAMGGGSLEIRKVVTADFNERGVKLRKQYVTRLGELVEKLRAVSDRAAAGAGKALLRNIGDLHDAHRRRLYDSRRDIDNADETSHRSSSANEPTAADEEIWKRFVESVLFLSDVEESATAVDLLRMDLFRKRPQLFEVWVVVTILEQLRRLGFRIELLGLGTSDAGRTLWNLNYAKSSKPIARCSRARDGAECFLFYQLFRAGERRDDMPDLALLPSSDAGDRPIWILDPKHSERRGYQRRDYEEVGRRYHATFVPQRTWIVEFYPRPDLGDRNPIVFVEGAELIRDVSPGGSGLPYLLSALGELHRGPAATTMAVIDISGSFRDKLPRVVDDVRARAAEGMDLSDDVIWFSDSATLGTGFLDLLAGRPMVHAGGGGTSFAPVLKLIEQLDREGGCATSLRIYSDGGFSDVSLDDALAQLRERGDAEIVNV